MKVAIKLKKIQMYKGELYTDVDYSRRKPKTLGYRLQVEFIK